MGQRQLLSFARDVQKRRYFPRSSHKIKSVTLCLPATEFLYEEYAEEDKSPVTKESKRHVKERPNTILDLYGCQNKYLGLRKTELQTNKNPGDRRSNNSGITWYYSFIYKKKMA